MPNVKSMILSLLGPRLLPAARVVGNVSVSRHFRNIEIESESLRGLSWEPGSKVQINTGKWVMRTYTPLSIDAENGRMKILAFLPGAGPGSAWASAAAPGDSTNFIGPQSSLKVSGLRKRVVLFGDETAFGLAVGLWGCSGGNGLVSLVFEVSSIEESGQVLNTFGISDAGLFHKSDGPTVHSGAAETVQKLSEESKDCQIVLAGRAQSIQAVRTQLKRARTSASRMTSKPYWSQGKAGLD